MKSTIAAFDFDNTLTDRDSLIPFLIRLKGFPYASLQFTLLTFSFIRFLLGSLSRQHTKEQVLERFIKDKSLSDLESFSREYAFDQLDRYVKPDALQKMKWHQAQGHRCILISASLEIYLKPWAERHGFETVLGSRLETTASGFPTGKLIGLNCWGEEKVRRLIEYAGPKENYVLYAYGDSKGDQPLLDMADHSFYKKF